MKKKLVLLAFLAGGVTAFGQKTATLHPFQSPKLDKKADVSFGGHVEKSLLCQDTIRYPQVKEQVLHTTALPDFYLFDIWEADAEEMAQTFLNTGPISIGGIEFFGSNNTTDGVASVTVTASIYNVDASNVPTTLVASGTTTFSSATADYHYVSFAPVTVSGNYAVVIRPTNADGVLDLVINNPLAGQPYDETFAKYKSNWYASSSGAWISPTSLTEFGNPNFEALVAPIVSYTINTSFTASPNPACLGTPVVYTGTNTPASTLNNRMYNYQEFEQYFMGVASDSTYVYDMDNTTLVWSNNTTYTHPAAGTYDVTYYTLGGFWNSCADFSTTQVVINPIPATPTITPGGPTTFCAGGSVTLTSSAASGNQWSTGATANSINVSSSTVITLTTTALGCTSATSAPLMVTVTPLEDATFNYTSNTLCTGGANETPTVNTAGGTFSSTPAGLDIDPATGEIDMATSADGTYSVTYTTAGTCPNSSSQNITITASPDATFTYSAATFCSADSDPAPAFGAGASGGTFTSVAGLVINPSTGVVDLSASTPGTYTVTNTIAAAGVCPMVDETFDVTINATPSATVSGGGTQCGAGTIPVTITLTGNGPWDFSYSDGANTTPVNGQAGSTYTINATANGTYTVTTVTSSGCSATGTGSATVVFNPNPVVTIGGLSDVCENGTTVSLVATPAGGVFSGTGVTGSIFDPSIGAGTYAIDYDYTDANGCAGNATTNITVNAAPSVSISALPDLCIYNSAVTLTQGTPAGGTYSGTGVSGGSFDPSVAGEGTHVITYTYTTVDGCTGNALENLVVDSCLAVNELSETDLMIVPNPANDVITISYTNTTTGEVELSLTSADGKIVAYRTIQATASFNETLDVSALSSGVYFVKLNMNTGTVSKKIIVQ
ncbi:MAG TPA: T9SS type A sorting domain-containing protein [Fluviicola sp.]|nr:T9SS type A sorting domain-containing protein [Fluviicola sp.]